MANFLMIVLGAIRRKKEEPEPPVETFRFALEDDTGSISLEDSTGYIQLEAGV